jgi:sugar lactone lactonase YvrE
MAFLLAVVALCAEPARVPFEYPIFLTVGPDRSIYVSDQDVPAIYKITPDGKASVLFKGQRRFRTPLYRPKGIAVGPNGDVFVCDPATMDVYRITPDGKATGLTGKAIVELNGKPGVRGEFVQPEGVAVAPDGTVYVSDLKLGAIFRIAKDGKEPVRVVDVPAPHGLALDVDGTLLVVSHGDSHLKRVKLDDRTVTNVLPGRLPSRPWGPYPLSVALKPGGGYLVTDNYNRCLWHVSKDGKAEVFFESESFKKVDGVGVDKDGNVAIADPGSLKVFMLSPQKKLTVAAEK